MAFTETFDGVTAPALPAGWNFDTGFATTTAQSVSAPNSLRLTGGALVQNYFNTTIDTNSGNLMVRCRGRVNAAGTVSSAIAILRSSTNDAASAAWTTASAYRAGFGAGSGSTTNIVMIRRVSGTDTTIGSLAFVSGRIPQDTWLLLEFRARTNGSQVDLTVRLQRADTSEWLQTNNTWGASAVDCLTVADTNAARITAAGYVGMRSQVQTGATVYIDDYSMTEYPAQVTGLTPSNATSSSVDLSWTAPASGGTPTDYIVQHSPAGAGTWTTFADGVSTGTTATVTGLTAGTNYDFRVAATNSAGTGTYSSTATQSTTGTNVTVAVNTANLIWSPYNWRFSGSTFAVSQHPGAYVKFSFTGTLLSVAIDTADLVSGSVSAGDYPLLTYSIDDGAWAEATVASTISLATGLAAGTHTAQIFIKNTIKTYDRWTTPISAVKITSFTLSSGSSIVTPTGSAIQRGDRMIVYGDSIAEGHRALTAVSDINGSDGRQAWGNLLGAALGAEVGIVGFSGAGWNTAGLGNSVRFYFASTPASQSWDKYSNGQSRLSGGALSPAPDYIVVNYGTNDSGTVDATLAGVVQGWLAAARAAAPSARIVIVIPFSRTKATAISDGFNAYQTATPDSNAKLVDLGTDFAQGFYATTQAFATIRGHDAQHPNVNTNAEAASRIASAVEQAFSSGTPISFGYAY